MTRIGRIAPVVALACALALLVALVVIAELGQAEQTHIGLIIDRSQQRQLLLADLLQDLATARAAGRGVLLTDDAQQLARYQDARRRIRPAVGALTARLLDEDRQLMTPPQRAAIRQLQVLTDAELSELAATQTLFAAGGPQQALGLLRSELGSRTAAAIDADAATLRQAEQRIVITQLARAHRLRIVSRLLMAAVALLNLTLLTLAALLLARQARRRAALTAQLERENEELERRVRRRTAELSALSNHLQQLSEREKATLARELHDELGGLLIAVKMDVSWLQKRWPDPAPEVQARWARVLKVLDDGVDFKRRVVENLRPTLLDNIGLLPAVRWVLQETCGRAGLRYTEIYPEREPPLTDDAAITVFRLVQESLTNIISHAQATHVRLQIRIQDQSMVVLIEDNGIGIEPARRDAVGLRGLAIMRHRVRSCGGTLDIDSTTPGGTCVRARLPLAVILKPPRSSERSAGAAAAATAAAPARALGP